MLPATGRRAVAAPRLWRRIRAAGRRPRSTGRASPYFLPRRTALSGIALLSLTDSATTASVGSSNNRIEVVVASLWLWPSHPPAAPLPLTSTQPLRPELGWMSSPRTATMCQELHGGDCSRNHACSQESAWCSPATVDVQLGGMRCGSGCQCPTVRGRTGDDNSNGLASSKLNWSSVGGILR